MLDSGKLFMDMIKASIANDLDRMEELARRVLDLLDQGEIPEVEALRALDMDEKVERIRNACEMYIFLVSVRRKIRDQEE